MARRLLVAMLLLSAALPAAGAEHPSRPCEPDLDPRCDPAYCVQKPADPYCADPDYCLHAADDPICAGWHPSPPCQWSTAHGAALPIGSGAPGGSIVTLDCRGHVKLGWACGSRADGAIVPRDPTPATMACALLTEERTGAAGCGSRWTWVAARAELRFATSWLAANVAPDADCDGRADAGVVAGKTAVEWR